MLYWGKTFKDGRWHHLCLHSLDVAGTLQALLNSDTQLQQKVQQASPMPYEPTRQLLIFLAAIHDLGKFSTSFQNLAPELATKLNIRPTFKKVHHTVLGLMFWKYHKLHERIGFSNKQALKPLVTAAMCHHGLPESVSRTNEVNRHFNGTTEDALVFVDQARDHFLTGPIPDDLRDESFRKLSWLAAGLFILADWVGSNELWFEPDPSWTSVAHYFPKALEKASRALKESHLLPVVASTTTSFNALLPHLEASAVPSSLQQLVLDLPEQSSPELLIFEDLTGGGKTEAALLAAHRAMRAKLVSGLFMGLPTMATANAMYARLARSYRALFEDPDASLVLAHGSRVLNREYLASITPLERASTQEHQDNDGAVCAEWFSDNRKKALLAPCGAGTLDQALLAVLSAKHQALRLLGISRSMLVVDEVHAYDTYTSTLLENLLKFHAALGGSAVLLSATLPQSLRASLVKAWQEGRSEDDSNKTSLHEKNFPLLTRISNQNIKEIPFKASRQLDVLVEPVHDQSAMFVALATAQQAGACACWVRNTVKDAVEARQRLITDYGLPEDEVILFHARFTGLDRMKIEEEVLFRFGKQSTITERNGKILIASQVVEQSLDLDFDILLSDLAPMELIIQRAGRCHRHERKKRPNKYNSPRMLVLMPEPVDKPTSKWFGNFFPAGQWVYRRPALLWRTARLLCDKKRLLLPDDARELVEGAYGNSELEAPAVLDEAENQADGEDFAARSTANYVKLDVSKGYMKLIDGGKWNDDTVAPTRLGRQSRQVRLVCITNKTLRLWAAESASDTSMKACLRSEVRVDAAKLAKAPIPKNYRASMKKLQNAMPDRAKWCLCLPMQETKPGQWVGHGQCINGADITVHYGPEGLEIDKLE